MRSAGPVRAALAAGALCAALAGAAEPRAPDWLGKEFGYVARNESLRSLLYDFGTSLDIPVTVSGRISAIADDEVPVGPAEQFLAEVHRRFGVIWVYDGAMLYLYDETEAVTKTVAFPSAGRDAFEATVATAGIRGAPLSWVVLPGEDAMQLAGPPRFVEWAAEAALSGAFAAQDRTLGGGRLAIRIFAVEHAHVGGAATGTDGTPAAVGVAEMVAKLMNVAHTSGIGVSGGPASTVTAKLRGTGVVGDAEAPGADTPAVGGRRAAADAAFVVGDTRQNAVVVRDLETRMPTYERLIAALDSPVDQVEITVSVLDIDASAADELRFSIGAEAVRLDAGASAGPTFELSEGLFDADGLALQVRALLSAGKSRILTRPSVTTLDNHEASFRNNRTFYVRLGGNDAEAVDLAPVSYGWVVRIRPHVVRDGAARRVRLGIHIEDGSRGGAELAVTGVPEVSQNVIQTQAVVGEGKSLLIGGYTVREEVRFRQRIPLLGRVPVLGRLLSARIDRDQQVSRYFLITPRILPAEIAYEINTGFEDAAPEEPVKPVPAAASEARAGARPGAWSGLDAHPAHHHAVQVIALSSAERLDEFVAAHGLDHMTRVERPGVAAGGFVLVEGVYADRAAALEAAARLSGDPRLGTPYVRRVGTLKPRAVAATPSAPIRAPRTDLRVQPRSPQ